MCRTRAMSEPSHRVIVTTWFTAALPQTHASSGSSGPRVCVRVRVPTSTHSQRAIFTIAVGTSLVSNVPCVIPYPCERVFDRSIEEPAPTWAVD